MQNTPAFPPTDVTLHHDWHGMTLRDYFAAKAMQGLLHDASYGNGLWEFRAKAAYKIADAMLEARKQ